MDHPSDHQRFLKSEKASLNSLLQGFHDATGIHRGAQWDYHIAEIDRMEQLTKQVPLMSSTNTSATTARSTADAQHVVPEVEKPQIDPDYRSDETVELASQILAMQVEEIDPTFVEMDGDDRSLSSRPGLICTMRRTRSMICLPSLSGDVGTEADKQLDWRPP